MEIILLENIIKLGKIGDQVKVKNGYARNFLLREGKALRVNEENIAYVGKKKDELNKKNLKNKQEFIEIAKKINNKSLVFSKETKDNGDLYASIKPKEISMAFESQLKIEVKPVQIVLKNEINKIGEYQLILNLYTDVEAKVSIKVKKLASN